METPSTYSTVQCYWFTIVSTWFLAIGYEGLTSVKLIKVDFHTFPDWIQRQSQQVVDDGRQASKAAATGCVPVQSQEQMGSLVNGHVSTNQTANHNYCVNTKYLLMIHNPDEHKDKFESEN